MDMKHSRRKGIRHERKKVGIFSLVVINFMINSGIWS